MSSEDEDEEESADDNSNMEVGEGNEDPAAVDEEGAPETPAEAFFYAMITSHSTARF